MNYGQFTQWLTVANAVCFLVSCFTGSWLGIVAGGLGIAIGLLILRFESDEILDDVWYRGMIPKK